jgi:TonB family protein
MTMFSSARHEYIIALRRALEDERYERATAVFNGLPVIEPLAEPPHDTGEQVRPPRPYRRIKPPYPDTAARLEIEAIVDALVEIDARGEVGHVQIQRWAGYGLDESVITTIKQMHFFPAMRDSNPIPLRVLLRYNFRKPPS